MIYPDLVCFCGHLLKPKPREILSLKPNFFELKGATTGDTVQLGKPATSKGSTLNPQVADLH